MKQRFLSCLLAVSILGSLVVPAFGGTDGGGGQECSTCKGWYDDGSQTAVVICAEPRDGSSGNSKCTVMCSTPVEGAGGCSCFMEGHWCYYIVVNS
jgi:hypothetical protein